MYNDQVLKIELAMKGKILKTYSFTKDVIVIGRIPTADIFIDNTGISREHTQIERSIGGPYIVRDLESTNGTFLNNAQVNEATLKHNDVINLGKFFLRVIIEDADKSKEKSTEMSPDDFDGTTVLSVTQMERLRASVAAHPVQESDNKPEKHHAPEVSPSHPSLRQPVDHQFVWAVLIILAGIVIGLGMIMIF